MKKKQTVVVKSARSEEEVAATKEKILQFDDTNTNGYLKIDSEVFVLVDSDQYKFLLGQSGKAFFRNTYDVEGKRFAEFTISENLELK